MTSWNTRTYRTKKFHSEMLSARENLAKHFPMTRKRRQTRTGVTHPLDRPLRFVAEASGTQPRNQRRREEVCLSEVDLMNVGSCSELASPSHGLSPTEPQTEGNNVDTRISIVNALAGKRRVDRGVGVGAVEEKEAWDFILASAGDEDPRQKLSPNSTAIQTVDVVDPHRYVRPQHRQGSTSVNTVKAVSSVVFNAFSSDTDAAKSKLVCLKPDVQFSPLAQRWYSKNASQLMARVQKLLRKHKHWAKRTFTHVDNLTKTGRSPPISHDSSFGHYVRQQLWQPFRSETFGFGIRLTRRHLPTDSVDKQSPKCRPSMRSYHYVNVYDAEKAQRGSEGQREWRPCLSSYPVQFYRCKSGQSVCAASPAGSDRSDEATGRVGRKSSQLFDTLMEDGEMFDSHSGGKEPGDRSDGRIALRRHQHGIHLKDKKNKAPARAAACDDSSRQRVLHRSMVGVPGDCSHIVADRRLHGQHLCTELKDMQQVRRNRTAENPHEERRAGRGQGFPADLPAGFEEHTSPRENVRGEMSDRWQFEFDSNPNLTLSLVAAVTAIITEESPDLCMAEVMADQVVCLRTFGPNAKVPEQPGESVDSGHLRYCRALPSRQANGFRDVGVPLGGLDSLKTDRKNRDLGSSVRIPCEKEEVLQPSCVNGTGVHAEQTNSSKVLSKLINGLDDTEAYSKQQTGSKTLSIPRNAVDDTEAHSEQMKHLGDTNIANGTLLGEQMVVLNDTGTLSAEIHSDAGTKSAETHSLDDRKGLHTPKRRRTEDAADNKRDFGFLPLAVDEKCISMEGLEEIVCPETNIFVTPERPSEARHPGAREYHPRKRTEGSEAMSDQPNEPHYTKRNMSTRRFPQIIAERLRDERAVGYDTEHSVADFELHPDSPTNLGKPDKSREDESYTVFSDCVVSSVGSSPPLTVKVTMKDSYVAKASSPTAARCGGFQAGSGTSLDAVSLSEHTASSPFTETVGTSFMNTGARHQISLTREELPLHSDGSLGEECTKKQVKAIMKRLIPDESSLHTNRASALEPVQTGDCTHATLQKVHEVNGVFSSQECVSCDDYILLSEVRSRVHKSSFEQLPCDISLEEVCEGVGKTIRSGCHIMETATNALKYTNKCTMNNTTGLKTYVSDLETTLPCMKNKPASELKHFQEHRQKLQTGLKTSILNEARAPSDGGIMSVDCTKAKKCERDPAMEAPPQNMPAGHSNVVQLLHTSGLSDARHKMRGDKKSKRYLNTQRKLAFVKPFWAPRDAVCIVEDILLGVMQRTFDLIEEAQDRPDKTKYSDHRLILDQSTDSDLQMGMRGLWQSAPAGTRLNQSEHSVLLQQPDLRTTMKSSVLRSVEKTTDDMYQRTNTSGDAHGGYSNLRECETADTPDPSHSKVLSSCDTSPEAKMKTPQKPLSRSRTRRPKHSLPGTRLTGQEEDYEEVAQLPGSRDMTSSYLLERPLFATNSDTIQVPQGPNRHLQTPAYCSDILPSGSNGDREDIKPAPRPQYPQWQSCTDVSFARLENRQTPKPQHSPPEPRSDVPLVSNAEDQDRTELPSPQSLPSGSYGDIRLMENIMKDHDTFKPKRPHHRPSKTCSDKPLISNIADPEEIAQLPCPQRPSRVDWIGIPYTGETAHLQNMTEAPSVQHSMSESCNDIPLVCNVENTKTIKLSGTHRLPSKSYSDEPVLDNDQGESEPLRARQPAPESCSKLALVCEHVNELKPLIIRHSPLVFCGDECPADSTQDHSMKPPMDQTAIELLRPRHASSEFCSDKPLTGSLEDPDKIAQPWQPQSPSRVLWKVPQMGQSCDLEEIMQSPRAYHPSSESCCDIRLVCRPKDMKKKKPLGAHRPFTSCSDIPLVGSGKHRMGYTEDAEEIPQPPWHPTPAHWIGTPPKAQDLTFQSESCSDVPLACKVQDTQTTTPLMTPHSPSEEVMQPLEPQRPTAQSCIDVPQRGRKEKDTDVPSTITMNTARERSAVSRPPARKALKLSGPRASRDKLSAKGRPRKAGGSDQAEQSLVTRECTAIHSVKGSALETSREECSVVTKEYCNLASGAAVQDCTPGVTSVTKATSDLLNTVYSCGISDEFQHEEMERGVQLSKSVSDSGRTQKHVELNSEPCMTKHLHPASLHGDGEQSSLSPQQWETLCTHDELITGFSDVRLQGKMSTKESTFVFSPKDLAMLYRPGEWVSGLSDDGHHKKTRKDNLLGVEKYSVSKRPPNTKSLCAASYSSFSDWGFMTPSLLGINSLVHTLSDTALAYTQATPIVGYHGKRNSDFNCTVVFYTELLKSYQTLKTSTLRWICSVMLKAFRDELTRRNAQRKFRPQPSFSESIVGKATLAQSTRYIIDRQNNSLSDADCDSVLALQETLTTATEALEKSVNSAKKSKSKQKQEESASTSDFPSVSKTPTPGCKQLNSNMSRQGTYGFEGVTAKQLLEIKNTITALEHCTNVYLRKTAESNLDIQSSSTCHTLPKNDYSDHEDSSPATPTPKTRPESPNCPCTPVNSEQFLSGLKETCSNLSSDELVSAEQLPSRVIRQSRDLERFTDRLKSRSRSQEHLSNRLRPRSRSLPSKWRLSSSFDESPESRNTDRDSTSSSEFSRYGVPFETDNDVSSTTTITRTRGHDNDGYSSPDLSSREECTSSSDEYQPEEDETRQSQEHVEMEDFLSLERAFLEEEEKQLRENISLCAQLAYDPFIDLPLSYIWPMESIPEEDEESDDLYESVENCTKPIANLSALPLKRLNKSSTSVMDMNYRKAEEFAAEIYGFDNMERSLSDTYLTANNAGTKTKMAVTCSQGRSLHICRGREALVGEKRHASFVSSLSTDSAGVSADFALSSASHTGSDRAFQMTPDPVRNKGTPVEPKLNVYKSTDEKSASPEAHSTSSLSAAGPCEKEMGDNTLPVHIAAPPVTMSSCVTALSDDLNLSVGQVATSVSPGTDCEPSSVVPHAISEFPGTNSMDSSSFVSTATSEAYSTQMIEPRSVESLATSGTLPTKSANLTSVTAVASFNLPHSQSATERNTGLFNPSDGPSQFGAVILPECLDQTCNINDFDFTAADKAVPYTSAELAASELPSVTPRRASERLAAPAAAKQVKKVPKPRPRRRSPESDAIGTNDAPATNSQVDAPFVESKLQKTEAHGTGATQSVSLPVKARRFLSKVQDPSSQKDKPQSCTSVAMNVIGCEISAAGSFFSKHVVKSKSIETSCDIEAHASTRKRSTSAAARAIPSKIRGLSTLKDDFKTMELSVFLAEENAQSTATNTARYVPIPSPRRRFSFGEASTEGHSLPLETQPGALPSTTKSSPGQDQQRLAADVASETSERRGESVPDAVEKTLLSCRVPVAGVARYTDPTPSAPCKAAASCACPHQALPVPSARTKFALSSSYDSKEAFTVPTSQASRVVDSYPQGQFLAAKASLKRFCISDQSVAAGYVVRTKPSASKQGRSAVATDSSSTQSFTPAYRVRLTVNELSRRSVARDKNASTSTSTEDVASVSTDSEKPPSPLARNDVDKVWMNASAAPFHQQGGPACVRPTPQARRSCTSDSSASSPLAEVCRHGESIATDVTHTSDEDCDSSGQFLLHDASTKRVGFEDKGDSSCSESDSSVLLSDVAGCDPGNRIKAEKMSSLNESSSLHKSEVAVGEEAKNVIVQDTFMRGQRTWARQDSTDSLFLPKKRILRANVPTAPTLSDSSSSDVEAVDFHRQALTLVDAVFNSDLQTATSSGPLDTDCRSSSNFGLSNRPLHELDAREEHQHCAETETKNTMKGVREDAPNIISYEESKNAHHDHHPRIARELQGQSSSESSQSGQSVNSDSSSSSEGRFTTSRRTGLRPASPQQKQHACQSPKVPEPRRRKSQTSSDQSNSTVPGTTSSSAGSLSWSSSSAGISGSTGGHAADEIATAEPFLGRNLPRRACSSLQNKEEWRPKPKPKTAEPWRPPSPDPAAKSDQVSGTLTESCSSPVLQMGPSLTNQYGSDTTPSRRACMELKITDDGAEKGPPDS